MKDNRKDYRNEGELKSSLEKYTDLEKKYIIAFVNRYNGMFGRKKKACGLLEWGAKTNHYYPDIKEAIRAGLIRPDYLYILFKDNSYLATGAYPIEVCTTEKKREQYYIKKHKILWNLDTVTFQALGHKNFYILLVIGTENPGRERYCLLKPNDIEKIKKGEIQYPEFFGGGKPCFCVKHDDLQWKRLFPFENTKQLVLIFSSLFLNIIVGGMFWKFPLMK